MVHNKSSIHISLSSSCPSSKHLNHHTGEQELLLSPIVEHSQYHRETIQIHQSILHTYFRCKIPAAWSIMLMKLWSSKRCDYHNNCMSMSMTYFKISVNFLYEYEYEHQSIKFSHHISCFTNQDRTFLLAHLDRLEHTPPCWNATPFP